MNRERAKELAPIIQAFGDGADIQGGPIDLDYWQSIDDNASFEDETQRFRIKPSPREFWLRIPDVWKTGDKLYVLKGSDPLRPKHENWTHVREVL